MVYRLSLVARVFCVYTVVCDYFPQFVPEIHVYATNDFVSCGNEFKASLNKIWDGIHCQENLNHNWHRKRTDDRDSGDEGTPMCSLSKSAFYKRQT